MSNDNYMQALKHAFEVTKEEQAGKATTPICPTGHESFINKLKDAHAPTHPGYFDDLDKKGKEGYIPPAGCAFPHSAPHIRRSVNGLDEFLSGLEQEESETLRVGCPVDFDEEDAFDIELDETPEEMLARMEAREKRWDPTPIPRALYDIEQLVEPLLGRLLGAARHQRDTQIDMGTAVSPDPAFSGELEGFQVVITPRPLTRYIQIQVGRCGFINHLMEPGWEFGSFTEEELKDTTLYQCQLNLLKKLLVDMHYGLSVHQHIKMEVLGPILEKRDHYEMKKILPPSVDYRFKGNKGCFFMFNGEEVFYKDRSVHAREQKVKEYAKLHSLLKTAMLKTSYIPPFMVDYNSPKVFRY
ncbi:hypothetical protein PQC07_gp095 [Aeromonas phage D3]|uniref:Uncharacterized protein n=1 Tax=Aeromonas phage D3 TaxID=2593327 RepID=A0A514TVA9_9CAUD|nr:hypothetical protein PQC07_gp095 [Aeromonas phage D3]QDJ96910.1 hypothetical protein D3_0180 [Aeromonas phage D3]